ncbi:hypothetical protein RHSIM_Rhsim05G0173000 [Rhododendron simsii]|uniref:Uncharacterized protein n=1 Tax=Rhododendron simsii TaxID=118357 RepID=A0A834GYA5_RHOSS|nr:hypothetical protein RHSIM_Rhsim05G0173000 [Rhododendron simsii]
MTTMKKQKSPCNHFDLLSEELIFAILDRLDSSPLDNKSFFLRLQILLLRRIPPHHPQAPPFRPPLKTLTRSVDLSRSKFFTHVGLSGLAANCSNLVQIDLSNATELRDLAAAAIAEAKNLERLWPARCKGLQIWELGVSLLGVGS